VTIKLAGTKFELGAEFTRRNSNEIGLSGVVDVRAFGALGDLAADDTVAIKAAIASVAGVGRGVVYFPRGQYKFTSQLVISSSNIILAGDGIGASMLFPTMTATDAIHFVGTAGTPLQRIGMRDISVYGLMTDPTAGALVRITHANNLAGFDSVELAAGFGALLLESVVHGYFHGVDLKGDANMTSRKVDSYLLRLSQASGGVLPAELHFYGAEWRGQSGNNYLDHGIWIEACDGIWFHGGHVGFVGQHGMLIKPATTTAQVTAVNTDGMFVDTCAESAVEIVETGGYTGIFGAHDIELDQVYNCGRGIRHNCATTDSSRLQIAQALELQNGAVRIIKGDDITARVDAAWQINKVAGSAAAIHVSGSGTGYRLYAAAEKKGSATPYAAIWLDGTIDQVIVEGGLSKSCTFDILRAAGAGTNVQIGPWVTDRSRAIEATGGGGIPVVLSQNVFSVGGSNNIGLIDAQYCVAGRTIHLIFSASLSVFDSNNLKINGTFSATADDCLTLVCDGTNWYEVARSAN